MLALRWIYINYSWSVRSVVWRNCASSVTSCVQKLFSYATYGKKLRYFYGKKKVCHTLLVLTDWLVWVLKSSAYLHFWSLMKSETKIAVFGSITRYLLAWSSSCSCLLYWQTAAVSRKIGFWICWIMVSFQSCQKMCLVSLTTAYLLQWSLGFLHAFPGF